MFFCLFCLVFTYCTPLLHNLDHFTIKIIVSDKMLPKDLSMYNISHVKKGFEPLESKPLTISFLKIPRNLF
ncbi:hypothetical protein DFH28DRAFT_961838 [Melampsora americana]|nr:hypothetical protein DFH28DRAFT_961838 [Melampsora americana]